MSAEDDITTEVLRRAKQRDVQDGHSVRALISEVTADYDDRALRGEVIPLTDRDRTVRAVTDQLTGLGPLQPYLDDPTIEEIWVNAPDQVFVAKGGEPELTTTTLDEQQVHELVERMLRFSGRRLDLSSPFVDATLVDGSRLHVVIPDITRRHWAVNVRKYVLRAHSLDELVRLGTMTAQCAKLLQASVVAGLNIVVAGATHAGKTTLLNCLAAAIPPRQRVITCEEVFELQIRHQDVVSMQTRQANLEGEGEISLRRLIKEALRMRVDRIIVGEVRQEECLDLLIALNSGCPGMTSVHASSAREALGKLVTLPLLAGENISERFIVPTVARMVDLIVFLRIDRRGRRRVEEVLAVPGRVEQDQIEAELVFHRVDGQLVWARGFPPHEEWFTRAGYNLSEVLHP
jgi:pilus assembly protein CpaF